MRMPATRIRLVGTPFHTDDLLMSMRRNPVWAFYRYAAEFDPPAAQTRGIARCPDQMTPLLNSRAPTMSPIERNLEVNVPDTVPRNLGADRIAFITNPITDHIRYAVELWLIPRHR